MSKLRIGLLVDDECASKYVCDLVRWAARQDDLEITHLIVHPAPRRGRIEKLLAIVRKHGAYEALGRILFALITLLERVLVRRFSIHRDHFEAFLLGDSVPRSIRIVPRISDSGVVYRFSDADVAAVRSLELDVLIRCGGAILRGAILSAARFGIVSFHHGDNRVNRGGPPAFWESYYGWPKTGFIIQRLTEELDGGEVFIRGAFPTQCTFALNQAHLYSKANVHLKTFLKRLAAERSLPPAEPFLPYSAPLYRAPQLHQGVLYLFKLAGRLAIKGARRIAGVRQRWGLSFAEGDWRRAVLWRSRSPALPKGRFWADPFLVQRDGATYCFVEDFVYRSGRGHITALEIGKTNVSEIGTALQEPFHLSFPFLFEYDGAFYMCPETMEARQIRIYRCLEFPLRWELTRIAMRDVSAVDTMLFPYGGKWWMFTNIDESGTGEHSSELYLFFADTPLATSWTPHPQNPIVIDPERARNAGLVIEGEDLYRLAQRHGFDQYGAGLSIWKVAQLSSERYREEAVGEITPAYRRGLRGTHHLSTTGRLTVVDHVTDAFVRV